MAPLLPASGDASLRRLLNFVRHHRAAMLWFKPADFGLALIGDALGAGLLTSAGFLVDPLAPDVQEYAISSAYARLIDEEVRKTPSACRDWALFGCRPQPG